MIFSEKKEENSSFQQHGKSSKQKFIYSYEQRGEKPFQGLTSERFFEQFAEQMVGGG
jgi:hypothetical protein